MALSIHILCDRCQIYGPKAVSPTRTASDITIGRIQKVAMAEGWTRPVERGRGVRWYCPSCAAKKDPT